MERYKKLYEWSKEVFLFDQGSRFIQFCKDEGRELDEVVSYTDFLILKEKFEA